jgi:3-oxoadipate enol-lactonase
MTEFPGVPMHGFASTRFGRVHYLEAGAGTPVVLLHSVGSSAYEFEHVIGRLAERFRVVAWDMPGHGDSGPLQDHLSIADYCDALLALTRHIGLTRPHLVGTSIGARIAAHAARQPAEVASVSLVELPLRSPREWGGIWPKVETMFCYATQSLDQVAPRFRNLTQAEFERWNIDRNKAGAKAMMSAMWALRDDCHDLQAIAVPSLLVYGEVGAVADGIPVATAALPAASIVSMPGCGHFPMIDDPMAFGDIIRSFISGSASP